jgi:hypothetical protein
MWGSEAPPQQELSDWNLFAEAAPIGTRIRGEKTPA